jgi:hypothetical protein
MVELPDCCRSYPSALGLGCVKTFATVSPTRKMEHVRAVLSHLVRLRGCLGHVPDQEFQPHRVFTQPRSEPGSRISIYSRARDSNSRTGCPVAGVPGFVHLHCFGKRVRRCRNAPLCRDRSSLRRVGVGLPGAVSPSRAKRPDTYSGPASFASSCSDRGIVQAHDIVSRSPVSVRRVCARI